MNVHDACRCLPDHRYLEGCKCELYYFGDPERGVTVRGATALATVRAQTQAIQGIMAEVFLTQRASNETTLGYINKSARGMRMVNEARQRVLLSLMSRRSGVYACCFQYKQGHYHGEHKSGDGGTVHWCIGVS